MKKKISMIVMSMLTLVALSFSMVACSTPTTDKTPEASKPNESILAGGMELGEIQNNGVKLMKSPILPTAYEDYGVMPTAESAFNLTATISPEDAANHGVDWYLSFDNPSSAWASGKNVEDYVMMSPSADTKTNTISCLQPFGNAIIVTAKSQDNPDVSAICRLEYSQKVTAASLNIGNIQVNLGGTTEIKYEVSSAVNGPGGVIQANYTTNDVYTIAENYSPTVTFSIPTDTEQWFNVKDLYPSGIAFTKDLNLNPDWHGLEYYFDYNHDMKNWMIMQRAGDILFKNLTTAQIIDYMSNITCNKLGVINLKLTGANNTYEYSSQLICTGYTNSTPVNNIDLSQSGYIF